MSNQQGFVIKLLLIIILILIPIYLFVLKPQFTTNKNNSPLELFGTSWKEGNPVAIINGTVLREGDAIEGYRILKIEDRSVILSYKGQKFKLTFSGLSSSSNIKDLIRYRLVEVGKHIGQIQNKISSLVLKIKEQLKKE